MMPIKAIILAAGKGTRLGALTENLPKGMVPIKGESLLHWHIQTLRAAGIEDITLVGGYQIEKLKKLGLPVIENPRYATTNMVVSLWCAKEILANPPEGGFVFAYSDILYNQDVVTKLVRHDGTLMPRLRSATGSVDGGRVSTSSSFSVVSDKNWRSYWEMRSNNVLGDAENFEVGPNGNITSLGQKVASESEIESRIQGQYIGLIRVTKDAIATLIHHIESELTANQQGQSFLCPGKTLDNMYMTDLLQGMINKGVAIKPVWTDGSWVEIDTPSDLSLAESLTEVSDVDGKKLLKVTR